MHAYLVQATSCVLGSKAPCGGQAQDPRQQLGGRAHRVLVGQGALSRLSDI